MQISLTCGGVSQPLASLIRFAQQTEADGFYGLWMGHWSGFDALTAVGALGSHTQRIRLGTSVVPIQARHPIVMAQQALAISSLCPDRFRLGIGFSHKFSVEGSFGLSFDRPAARMGEYVRVLQALFVNHKVAFDGDHYRANIELDSVGGAGAVPILLAALGPRMLKLAGESTAGTITWMCGLRTLETHVIPSIKAAAAQAGNSRPSIVSGLPVVVTDDESAVRARLEKQLAFYGTLPSYQAMLAREGAARPSDIALVGNEEQLAEQLARLRALDVSELAASLMSKAGSDEYDRTMAFLRREQHDYH